MTDFEDQLRQSLQEAAGAAPSFQVPKSVRRDLAPVAPNRSGPRRSGWRAVVAVILAAIVVFGVIWLGPRPGQETGLCPVKITFENRTYFGWTSLVSVPRPDRLVGMGIESTCPDEPTESVDVYEIPGVSTSMAVLSEGQAWIVDGGDVPPEVRALIVPIRCQGRSVSAIEGRIDGIDPNAEIDAPPYLLTFVADSGEALPLADFESVTLDLRVTPSTVLTGDPDLIRVALLNARRVRAVVSCAGSQFVAQELVLIPQ